MAIAPELFGPNRLPRKPYCSNNCEHGLVIRKVDDAIKYSHIQMNPPSHLFWMVFDVDKEGASDLWDGLVAKPNYIVINPQNGHAHYLYALEAPVAKSKKSRIKPLMYFSAIESEYIRILGADRRYSKLICKNPLNEKWKVIKGPDWPYSLDDLAQYVPSVKNKIVKKINDNEVGRNCAIFNSLRIWAYQEMSSNYIQYSDWYEKILSKAEELNIFEPPLKPLSCSEVRSIAKSVAKWCFKHFSCESQKEYIARTHNSEIQRIRGKNGGIKSGISRKNGSVTEKQPWLEEGVSRATWYRRNKNCRLSNDVADRVDKKNCPLIGEAQLSYGKVRVRLGEKMRQLGVFVLYAPLSPYWYVQFVDRLDLDNWLDCHVRAFNCLGGVPKSVLIDMPKVNMAPLDPSDPVFRLAYAELKRHYGFTIDWVPEKTQDSRETVARQISAIRKQLITDHNYADIAELNRYALMWCKEQAGGEILKIKSKPSMSLTPLPSQPFSPPTWTKAKVHPDHHIYYDSNYYSLPTCFVGKTVQVKGNQSIVEIYHDGILVKTHHRANLRGRWVTDHADYPALDKVLRYAYPSYYSKKAAQIGPNVERMVKEILDEHAIRHLRRVQRILGLAAIYGGDRLDEACNYLLFFGSTSVRRLEHTLKNGIPLYMPSRSHANSR